MIWQYILTTLFAFAFPITSAAIINYFERKILAWIADRVGPLHTGPHGSLQLIADILKMALKEDIHPIHTDKAIFLLAPSAFIAPVIAAFAVLPFSPFVGMPGTALATGIVYLVAMSSLDIIGVIMAGWGSNNKYSLMGGLRSAAQMISYELPLVLALVGIIMLTSALAGTPGYGGSAGVGTISIKEIMTFQNAGNWPGKGIPFFDFIFQGNTPWAWFILVQPLMLVVYYICGLAETNRVPFDLPTAESELVAGFLTEYSGLRWAMFFLGEYGNMTIVGAIVTSLFLGGWAGPGVAFLTAPSKDISWQVLGNLLGILYFIGKVYLLIGVFIWVQGTLPRLRSDQLMQFAWLVLMPVGLGNILLTAMLYLLLNSLGAPIAVFLIVLGVVNWSLLFLFVRWISHVTNTSTRKASAPALHAQQRRVQHVERLAVPIGAAAQKEERLLH
ncbi:MAG TPA: complex I subunit 1 family protein [Ktedonobacteraceae bacterium]|nr:complex I subunit 1 family protein [Ktedonobacteraceae bacterium]